MKSFHNLARGHVQSRVLCTLRFIFHALSDSGHDPMYMYVLGEPVITRATASCLLNASARFICRGLECSSTLTAAGPSSSDISQSIYKLYNSERDDHCRE